MQTFAKQLNAVRKERHITQEQLAQELNVSRTTISRWESGKVLPDIETIKQLSQVLNYNFFTVEGLADTVPAQEAPIEENTAAPETTAVRKRSRGWMYAAGGLCLLVLCLFLLSGIVKKHANTAEREGASAQLVVIPSAEVAYLEPHGSGAGWYINFSFENLSDVPFHLDGVETVFYENEKSLVVLNETAADLGGVLDVSSLVKGDEPQSIPYSVDMLNLTHAVCRVHGKDDNGNAVEAQARIEFSQDLLAMKDEKQAALKAMGENPNAAHVAAAASTDIAYLEPFDDTRYGWNVVFCFQNFSDVAFKPDGLEVTFYENDTVCWRCSVPYEDIRYHMSNGKLYNGGIPLQFPVGADRLNYTRVTCRIFGTDDNGNPVDVGATVQLSQERLDPANNP